MNFVTGVNYMLIMKPLCALLVVVVAVAASPGCLSYCDLLHSGWKISRRSDCNCMTPQTKLQDEIKNGVENDLKSIFFPIKSQNSEPKFKNLHKDQEYDRISWINNFSGFGNNKPREATRNMMKRTTDDGDIPLEIDRKSSSRDVINIMHISETNLSDCIDLHILINIRKNKNKNYANLDSKVLRRNNLNDLEINAEIKSKCDQAIEIIQQSVSEIKDHHRLNSRRNDQNANVITKIEPKIAPEEPDESIPVINNHEDIDTIHTVRDNISHDESNAIYTTDNTPLPTSEALNYFDLSLPLDDTLRETADKYNNLNDLNHSIEVLRGDNTTNTTDISQENVIENITSTQLKDIQTAKEIESDSFYTPTDDLVIEKSTNPVEFSEKVQNKSMLIADNSDIIELGTLQTDELNTDKNKTTATKTIDIKKNHTSQRNRYDEDEVPIIRIITREFLNNTISSVINGTEKLPNSDFEEEIEINNNKIENISDAITLKSIIESEIQSKRDYATPAASQEQTFANTLPIINGRLYFVYGQKYVPGYFVQTPKGQLQLSLDFTRICNELTQKEKQDALPIATFCESLKLQN